MRQTNKIRKGIAWLLCTVLVLGILPMLPQMSMQISAAENAASVFVDGVELHAGGKEYFKMVILLIAVQQVLMRTIVHITIRRVSFG